MQSSLKNICKSLKFFYELDLRAQAIGQRLERRFIKNRNSNSKTTERTAKCCSERNQTFKHESLILAQDERWRRA